jgi:Fic family protein
MLIPPKYSLTPKISQLLSSIEASRAVIESIEIPSDVELNIRRSSSLKSSLYSARIEGNSLTLDDLSERATKDIEKTEIYNILKALNKIAARKHDQISVGEIKNFHKIVMRGLISDSVLGQFRKEASAIFNSAGIAIYMPPPPSQLAQLMNNLVKFINGQEEQFVPIRAVLAHYVFEKIHPFLDGNGRVGRLFIQAILYTSGYGMKGLLPIEEYLDTHREGYYAVLDNKETDVTEYLEFVLAAIAETAEKTKQQLLLKKDFLPEDTLLPRRGEILNVIRDHKMVNFDQIRRRFLRVNERTLRYDLKKLADAGFVKKLGSTKGVYYEAV